LKPGRYARVEIAEGADATAQTTPVVAQQFAAARASFDARRYDEARQFYEAALAAEPANVSALNRFGVANRKVGRFADARAAYERAIQADPTYADAERNLAIVLDLYLGDAAAALPHLERYQSLTSGADTEVAGWVTELKARLAKAQRTAETKP
jgi:tetratricopeptide (TPR) repeat protein